MLLLVMQIRHEGEVRVILEEGIGYLAVRVFWQV